MFPHNVLAGYKGKQREREMESAPFYSFTCHHHAIFRWLGQLQGLPRLKGWEHRPYPSVGGVLVTLQKSICNGINILTHSHLWEVQSATESLGFTLQKTQD